MAQVPITTIPPFNDAAKLPDCAKKCGPLYDANGACVPPAAPSGSPGSYTACFCANAKVRPFAQGTTGVCDQACQGNDAGLQSIANWFRGICSASNNGAGANQQGGAKNDGGSDQNSDTPGPAAAGAGGGGDWLSHHWQWVIMIVVLVVGIAAIWIGACVWRRRYLRKQDRQPSLGQKHSGSVANPSWGPAIVGSESVTPMTYAGDPERSLSEKAKKKAKKTWTVGRRT